MQASRSVRCRRSIRRWSTSTTASCRRTLSECGWYVDVTFSSRISVVTMNWQPLYPIAAMSCFPRRIVGLLITARRIAVSSKTRRWISVCASGSVMAALVCPAAESDRSPRDGFTASSALGRNVGRLLAKHGPGCWPVASRWGEGDHRFGFPLECRRSARCNCRCFASANSWQRSPVWRSWMRTKTRHCLPKLGASAVPYRRRSAPRGGAVFRWGGSRDRAIDEIATAYRELEVPVHTMVPDVGDLRGDVAITKLAVPQRVATGDQATVAP